MRFGEQLPHLQFPKAATKKLSCFTIIVSQVVHPEKFYFQFVGKEFEEKLIHLMISLDEFYKTPANNVCYSVKSIHEGLFVATKFGNEWHRAVVMNVLSANECRVSKFLYC